MTVGRPTAYQPEFAKNAYAACVGGATNASLAAQLGVSRSTIDSWIAKRPDFSDAVKAGRAAADHDVVSALYARAVGRPHTATRVFLHDGKPVTVEYTVEPPPDVRACIFWLRNRRPAEWREDRPRKPKGGLGPAPGVPEGWYLPVPDDVDALFASAAEPAAAETSS